jgi:hypothetical protein
MNLKTPRAGTREWICNREDWRFQASLEVWRNDSSKEKAAAGASRRRPLLVLLISVMRCYAAMP